MLSVLQLTVFNVPKIGLIGITALLASVNPCTIGILILIASALLGSGKSKKQLLISGLLFISTIFTAYLLVGYALLFAIGIAPTRAIGYLALLVGSLVALAGLIHIKDYFWYGKGFSLTIPQSVTKRIQKHAARRTSLFSAIVLGLLIAGIELPCTCAPYIAVLIIIRSNVDVTTMGLIVLYAILFVLPLILILLLIITGTKVSALQRWKEEHKQIMRLLLGLLMIALGWILILTTNGTLNFG